MKKQAEITQMIWAEMHAKDIAKEAGVSIPHVYYVARKFGLRCVRPPYSRRPSSAPDTLQGYREDPANSIRARLSDEELSDLDVLIKHRTPQNEALEAIGRPDLMEPKLPQLTPSGAYDRVDVARYLKQAQERGMLPKTIARKLRLPLDRVIYAIGGGSNVIQRHL